MNTSERITLWDSIQNYIRRNPESIHPPSERINPDIPGSYFWVILVTNWDKLHPLIQDVLFVWYKEISRFHGESQEELDPKSTEALLKRFEELDTKLKAFDVERTNLEQELNIRDRDFQRLRSLTGKKEKENIEVQQMLGKSFQEKIMEKQNEIEEKEEKIRTLTTLIQKLEKEKQQTPINSIQQKSNSIGDIIMPQHFTTNEVVQELKYRIEERTRLLRQVNEQLKTLNEKVISQKQIIAKLENDLKVKDERIKEIKGLLQI